MTYKTADLCDGCDFVQVCELPFRNFGQKRSFDGAIRTVRCYEDFALIRDTVKMPGHDQVLVIDGGGSLSKALLGDLMAKFVLDNDWAGLVIHGAVRDSFEIDKMPVGVKALGTAPRRGERTGIGEIDVPVHFGGVTFCPGRWLVADDDGVIVLPEGVKRNEIRILVSTPLQQTTTS